MSSKIVFLQNLPILRENLVMACLGAVPVAAAGCLACPGAT